MKKLPAAFSFIFLFLSLETSANIKLVATFATGDGAVNLRWNMVNYPDYTAYTLFKSDDGVAWTIAAANPVFRPYTASTILGYTDNFSNEQKLYYRVKVYDRNENIVEISNTTVVDNPLNNSHVKKSRVYRQPSTEGQPMNGNKNAWQIFPNPVGDMLNLVYRGNDIIKGVINIIILDASGKAIIRFRAASNNKQLHIDVSKLHAGIYFIKLNVLNEIQMNDKFIKQ